MNSLLLKDLGTDDHARFHEKGLSGMDPVWLVALRCGACAYQMEHKRRSYDGFEIGLADEKYGLNAVSQIW